MGAGAFDGRVRDGIGSGCSAWATRPAKLNTWCSEAGVFVASMSTLRSRLARSGAHRQVRQVGMD